MKHSYPAFKQSQTMLQMISLNWVMYKMVPVKSTRPYELINYIKLDDLPTNNIPETKNIYFKLAGF